MTWLDRRSPLALANQESGTVTAELVLTLPAVALVLAFAGGLMSLQITRLELSNSAAFLARAIARGEPIDFVDSNVRDLGEHISFEIQETEQTICVVLKSKVELLDFEFTGLEMIETQCAKSLGQ